MNPSGPRSALRRPRKVMIAVAVSATLVFSAAGIESASASTRSRLAVSLSPDRSNAVRLDGATMKGKIYVFVRNSDTLDKVDFYLDYSSPTQQPTRTDTDPPFDFSGTATDGTALPYDTTKLADGSHTMRAVLTWSNGRTSSRRGNFTVANSGPTASPSASPTTPTTVPTANTGSPTTPTTVPTANTGSPTTPNTTVPATTAAAPTTTTATPTAAPPVTSTPTTQTPTSKPSQSSTAPTPRATPPASPAPSCLAGGGVAIGVGDDARGVVNAHSAGTTYIVKAGTHLRNFSVQPKSGDRFCGEPGAVLDGGRSLASAFSGGATNVTLDSITVQEYNPGWQGAAILPQTHASGWVVRNVSALRNGWAGLMAADGMQILGGHYNDNDQLGIGGNAATGVLLDGLDGDTATFDGPELARNHALHASYEFEAGGMKWDVGQVTIRNVHAHHNDYRGLWADINARGALIEHNLVEDNWAEGIFYEISQDAVIRNNRVYRNGVRAAGWYWDGGITVASSFNVEVYSNRLSGNHNGITGTQQNRLDSTPPAHLLDNYHVHDNLICATGGGGHPTGVVADNGANLALRDISFSGNTIQSTLCE
jgi:Right handed beta helix region